MSKEKLVSIMHFGQLYPLTGGGISRILNIAKMSSQYYDTTVIGCIPSETSDAVEIELKVDGVKVIQKKFNRSSLSMKVSKLLNFYYKSFKQEIKEIFIPVAENSDLVQIEGVRLFTLVQTLKKPVVIDMHNVDYELIRFISGWRGTLLARYWYIKAKRHELNCMRKADHIILTSEIDKKKYLQEDKKIEDKITIIPNCVDLDYFKQFLAEKKSLINTDKPVIFFSGTLDYYPNLVAIKDIIPMAREMENCIFLIAGKNPPTSPQLPKNVIFTGFVEDIRPFMSVADICIAPIRIGGGTRVKILEYMAMKKPTITTTKGCEGLEIDSDSLILEDNLNKYKEIIVDLLSDERKRELLADKAQKEVKSKYDWKLYTDQLKSIYENLLHH